MVPKNAVKAQNICVFYKQECVLAFDALTIQRGSLTACVGPNGGGKTTFLKSLVDLIPYQGTITIFDQPFAHVRNQVAYIPQRHSVDWDFPIVVRDVVMMGRYGHLGFFKRPQQEDHYLVDQAIEQVCLSNHAATPLKYLSGGQQQRVFLARALTQQPNLYLLDEPFNGVDEATEGIILSLLKQQQQQGKTVVIVHHDLQTVMTHFQEVITINKRIISQQIVTAIKQPIQHQSML